MPGRSPERVARELIKVRKEGLTHREMLKMKERTEDVYENTGR